MGSKITLQPSITAIHGDLTFSKRDVNLWVKLTPTHYEFQNDETREKIAEDFSLALANILNSEENELECQIYVTSKLFDIVKWRNDLLDATKYAEPTQYYDLFTQEMANHMWNYQFREKNVYLGVNLGYRTDFSPKKAVFKIKALDELMTRLTGEVDEYVTEKELEFWEDRARLIRYSLMESNVKALPVSATEIAYIIRKNMFPNMPSPSIDDLNITGSQVWGAGELETLFDADIGNGSKWLEIEQTINNETYKGYRATLCFAKFPESLQFPQKEPWIHSASLLGFPVDIYSRFSVVPSNKVKKQVGNKIKAIEDQAKNMTSAGGDISLEVRENYQLGQYLDYALSKSDIPWLYGRHRIVVEASTEQELKERCQSVIDHYKNLNIIVVWSSGDQVDLLLEGTPNDKIRLSSYYQRHELSIMGAGVPTGAGGAGDFPIVDETGQTKGWLGAYLGYTTSRVVEPVFLSPHSSIAKNKPGIVITGSSGSGKSFTAFTLTYGMVQSGVKTIYIDPKMDALPLATLPGCEDSFIVDLREGHDGILDPFQVGRDEGEKIDLVLDTILMLIGGERNLTQIASAELSKTIKVVLKDKFPSLNKLTEIMLNSSIPDAAALGERLSIIRKLPFARLCFSTISRTNPVPHLNLSNKLTIVTLYGLSMPTSDTKREDYNNRNHLAVAILFLLTSFTQRLIVEDADKYLPKAIVIDEAWAITSTAQGAKMVMEVARMGRSLNTALVLVSQNAGDFLGEGVTNSIFTKLAFRAQSIQEADAVLDFFNLPITKANRDVILNLNVGECLLKDSENRIARVYVDRWNRPMNIAFETNPVAKRLNSEQMEEQPT